jgi:hypothetical protein
LPAACAAWIVTFAIFGQLLLESDSAFAGGCIDLKAAV